MIKLIHDKKTNKFVVTLYSYFLLKKNML